MIGEGETITYAQATTAQRGRWPTCLKCRAPVDSITVSERVFDDESRRALTYWRVSILCHGSEDAGVINQADLVAMPAGHNPIALVEKWNYGYAFTEFAARITYVRTRADDAPELSKAHAILLRASVERAIDLAHAEGSRGFHEHEWRRIWNPVIDEGKIVTLANHHLAHDAGLDLEVSAVRFGDKVGDRYFAIAGVDVRAKLPALHATLTLTQRRIREAESALKATIDREIENLYASPTPPRFDMYGMIAPLPSTSPPKLKGRESLTTEGKAMFDRLVDKYVPASTSHMADAVDYAYTCPPVPRRVRLEAEQADELARVATEYRARSEHAWRIIGEILIAISRAYAMRPDLDATDIRFALLEFT